MFTSIPLSVWTGAVADLVVDPDTIEAHASALGVSIGIIRQ
jgi:hypothetical protein